MQNDVRHRPRRQPMEYRFNPDSTLCRTHVQLEEAFDLAHLRKGGAFDGTGIDHRWVGAGQYLMPVDVSTQHPMKLVGKISATNDVGALPEREISRSDRGPFDALMNAEQPQIRGCFSPSCLLDQMSESASDVVPLVRKS